MQNQVFWLIVQISAFTAHNLDYLVSLPFSLALVSKDCPFKRNSPSALSIIMNLNIFQSLVPHRKLRVKWEGGSGGGVSRQRSEDKKKEREREICRAM